MSDTLTSSVADPNKGMTTQELVDWIKEELGAPTFPVNLTEKQIANAIRSTLDEISNFYSVFKYLTIDLPMGRNTLDLMEYAVKDVVDVIKVDTSRLTQDPALDPFSFNNQGVGGAFIGSGVFPGFAAMDFASQRIGQTNIHRVITSYARMHQEMFYHVLASTLANRVNQTLMPGRNWNYDSTTSRLYVDTGIPPATVITIEYIPSTIDVEDVEPNTRYIGFLRDMATARAQITEARISGKFGVGNSPVEINYGDMRAEGEATLARVRDELKATFNNFYAMG